MKNLDIRASKKAKRLQEEMRAQKDSSKLVSKYSGLSTTEAQAAFDEKNE